LNFLNGKGSVIGAHMVDHKDVDLIAFTGSREVGLWIWETAGKTREGQRELKRVLCEMGGKNAVIIDSDADLDEAILDTIYSAFGYQGQKCSACSRLIILEDIYPRAIERLLNAAASLHVGNPEDPAVTVGPVIDGAAHKRILEYIDIGKKEARLAFQRADVPAQGYFIPPTIFTNVSPQTKIACEEIFGPVVSLQTFKSEDEVITRANDTEYGLVAYLYTKDLSRGLRVSEKLDFGMIGLNRGIVSDPAAPFGGMKQSGLGREGAHEGLMEFLETQYVSVTW